MMQNLIGSQMFGITSTMEILHSLSSVTLMADVVIPKAFFFSVGYIRN
jgi:hypothetical protein